MRPNQNLTRCSKKIPKVGTTCPNHASAASKPLIRLTPNLVKSRKASQTAQVGLKAVPDHIARMSPVISTEGRLTAADRQETFLRSWLPQGHRRSHFVVPHCRYE